MILTAWYPHWIAEYQQRSRDMHAPAWVTRCPISSEVASFMVLTPSVRFSDCTTFVWYRQEGTHLLALGTWWHSLLTRYYLFIQIGTGPCQTLSMHTTMISCQNRQNDKVIFQGCQSQTGLFLNHICWPLLSESQYGSITWLWTAVYSRHAHTRLVRTGDTA